MRRSTFFIACCIAGLMNAGVGAQTTDTTTTTTTPTGPTTRTTTGSADSTLQFGTSTGSFSGGTGAQGGQGMTGGTGFSGGSAFAGGQGGTQGQGGRAGTATTTVPSTYNPFRTYYKTYSAAGAGATTKTFGQPILATVTTTQAQGQAGRGTGGLGRVGGNSATGLQGMGAESSGFSTVGVRRAASYSTSLGKGIPIVNPAPMALLGDLRTTLAKTDALPSKQNVQVSMDGNTVVLRGQVEDDRERRVVEGMMRLTPGVREIRNELTTTK